MGMFLSKYSMLKALGYNQGGYILPETKKILSRFKLYAIVLHDPVKHAEFDRKFRDIYPRLDYLTGEKMLFFGLTHPPDSWVKANQGRDYFGIWEADKLLNPANAYSTVDDSLAAYSLANTLGIDFNDLPVLIFSADFQNKSCVVLPTCEQHIEKQLTESGLFASWCLFDKVNLVSDEFKMLIKAINLCGDNYFYLGLNQSLARILSDFLAFAINDPKSLSASEIMQHREKVICEYSESETNRGLPSPSVENKTKLLTFLSLLRKEYFLNDHPLFMAQERNREQYSSICYDLPTNDTPRIASLYNINQSRLDYESSILLKTTENVISFYNQKYTSVDVIDYSPIIIGVGKIFEKEINLSVVHWVRKLLKIDLPEFFNKYEPGRQGVLGSPANVPAHSPKSIDFNKGNQNKWIPPGIGESELVVNDLFQKGNTIDFFDSETEVQLCRSWTVIRQIRNKAAHMNVVDFQNCTSIINEFNGLSRTLIFDKMYDLKDLYSGKV